MKADAIPDEMMERIARKIGEGYVSYGSFWQDLESITNDTLSL